MHLPGECIYMCSYSCHRIACQSWIWRRAYLPPQRLRELAMCPHHWLWPFRSPQRNYRGRAVQIDQNRKCWYRGIAMQQPHSYVTGYSANSLCPVLPKMWSKDVLKNHKKVVLVWGFQTPRAVISTDIYFANISYIFPFSAGFTIIIANESQTRLWCPFHQARPGRNCTQELHARIAVHTVHSTRHSRKHERGDHHCYVQSIMK
jgi:hypothetical protein